MATRGCCGLAPSLFRRKVCGFEAMKDHDLEKKLCKNHKEVQGMTTGNGTIGLAGNLILDMELRKKILSFRDILDLPPCATSASIDKLVMGTMEDLQKLYPEIIPNNRLLEIKGTFTDQGLIYFLGTLRSIGESWMMSHDWTHKFKYDLSSYKENINPEHLVEIVLEALDSMNKMAREKFDIMDEDDMKDDSSRAHNTFGKVSRAEYYSDSNSSCCASPASPGTPTSVLSEPFSSPVKAGERGIIPYNPPTLWSLRVRAVGKLKPVDVKRLALNELSSVGGHDCSALRTDKKVEEPMIGVQEKNNFEVIGTIDETRDVSTERDTPEDVRLSCDLKDNKPKDIVSTIDENNDSPATSVEITPLSLVTTPTEAILPLASPPPSPPNLPHATVETGTPAELPSHEAPTELPSHAAPTKLPPSPPPPPPIASGTVRAAPPPPPPMMTSKGSPAPQSPTMDLKGPPPPPPPSLPLANGAAPPPPPLLGGTKSLRPKKSATKLKRSSQMGNLYRVLKGKVEGSSDLDGKSRNGRKTAIPGSGGGKQGMADALAEITRRSGYFQQIEVDVQKYAKPITELKSAINTFQAKDMTELIKFQKNVESILEHLTDESQVLARFEGFPVKKLETLRTAAALYSKLDSIITQLHNWKIVAPLGQLLDNVERYFTKIKGEVDALERTKDEESKKFQSYNINFDFNILIRIKEAMVDVSSSCMEWALKESRDARATGKKEPGSKSNSKTKGCVKMLWRAFQFAFRVYTFAGGHDDRADMLTRELAHEIENDPHH